VCAAEASWLVTDLVLAIQVARSGGISRMPSHKTLTSGSNRKSGQSPDPAPCHGVLLGWLRKLRSKSLKVLCNDVTALLILARDNLPGGLN